MTMNTGPIIGGTRDGEQHSAPDKFSKIPARTSAIFLPGNDVAPGFATFDTEQLQFVAFYFSFPARSAFYTGRDVRTGFWVCLNHETQRFTDDAEYRLFVLMKLSERYIEKPDAIKKRLFALYEAGQS